MKKNLSIIFLKIEENAKHALKMIVKYIMKKIEKKEQKDKKYIMIIIKTKKENMKRKIKTK
jgi:hypothetical protein